MTSKPESVIEGLYRTLFMVLAILAGGSALAVLLTIAARVVGVES